MEGLCWLNLAREKLSGSMIKPIDPLAATQSGECGFYDNALTKYASGSRSFIT